MQIQCMLISNLKNLEVMDKTFKKIYYKIKYNKLEIHLTH